MTPRYHASIARGAVERVIAAVALAALTPLLGLLMLLVRATSRGPAIYRQTRLGLGGKPFEMLKLRSMRVDAESGTGAVWASTDDPRVTPLGWWLRKLHLDELPQLWNIVRGDMSFVGPRPERPEMVGRLAEAIPGYCHRVAIRPGVTGLAQVNLPPDQTIGCVKRKLELDQEYVFTASASLDARIVACTMLKMIGTPRGLAARTLLVRRSPRPAIDTHAQISKPAAAAVVADRTPVSAA